MPQVQRTKRELQEDIASQEKTCNVCKIRKPFVEFSVTKEKYSPDKRFRMCKACHKAERARVKTKDPVKYKNLQRRAWLKHKYGISVEKYEQLLALQDGTCALCDSDKGTKAGGLFHVDHCHETGKIRGLLCQRCNVGLGLLGDNILSINKVINYLYATPYKLK